MKSLVKQFIWFFNDHRLFGISLLVFLVSLGILIPVFKAWATRETNQRNDKIQNEYSIQLATADIAMTYILVDDITQIVYYQDTLTPFYSENGKLCRVIDGKLVEVTGDDGAYTIIEGYEVDLKHRRIYRIKNQQERND